jgi:hypothetical protein
MAGTTQQSRTMTQNKSFSMTGARDGDNKGNDVPCDSTVDLQRGVG